MLKTADFRKKMPVKKYFPIKECKQLSLLGKHEPDRKIPSFKHYKLVCCHKTLQIQIFPYVIVCAMSVTVSDFDFVLISYYDFFYINVLKAILIIVTKFTVIILLNLGRYDQQYNLLYSFIYLKCTTATRAVEARAEAVKGSL